MFLAGPLVALALAASHAVQERTASPPPPSPNDIIVRDRLARPDRPVTVTAPPPTLTGRDPDKSATYADAARRAALCAVKGRLTRLSLLREVVDGTLPSAAQARAQRWLVRQTAACGEGAAIAQLDGGGFVTVSTGYNAPELFLNLLRRGEFVAQALIAFAPGDPPTREQLADPAVQQRFVDRESSAARKRQPQDLAYFRVAICMVREQPALAARLVRTDPVTTSTTAIQAHLVENARGCVGHVERVVVDPYEFRSYIADALYRWTVAARGVDTLIPATAADAERLRAGG